MASIKDALEESLQDTYSWPKYIIYSIPAFLILNTVISGKSANWLLGAIIFSVILYLGFILNCTYNVRMGNDKVLPSFNILGVLWDGLKCFVALAPIVIIGYIASSMIIKLLPNYLPAGIVLNIFNFAVIAIFISLILTGYLLYIKRFKILDAYNVKFIFQYSVDVMIAAFFMFFLIALVDVIIAAPITYVLWLFMGIPNPVAIFVWCMIGLLNVAMTGHYLAQIDYEIIPFNKDEEDIVNKTINEELK